MGKQGNKKAVGLFMVEAEGALYGAHVANRQWVTNTVRHGGLDEYHLFCSPAEKPQVVEEHGHPPHVKVFTWAELPRQLQSEPYVTLQCFGVRPGRLYALRDSLSPHPFPVCTITHSLGYHEVLTHMVINLLAHRYSYDTFICGTPSARQVLLKVIEQLKECPPLRTSSLDAECVRVIPHGVDLEACRQAPSRTESRTMLGLPQDADIVTSLGRFSLVDKIDYHSLLAAFALLCKRSAARGRVVLLLLAGSDRYGASQDLHRIAARYEVAEQVKILPNFPDRLKLAVLGASDVFVSLANSVQESFGLTILEAMACGVPVVATEWDGYRDLVTHSENGLLVKTAWRDTPEKAGPFSAILPWESVHGLLSTMVKIDGAAVAEAVGRVLEQPGLRQRLQTGAGKTVAQLAWPAVIRTMEQHWLTTWTRSTQQRASPATPHWYLYQYQRIFDHYVSPTNEGDPRGNRMEAAERQRHHVVS